MEKQHLRVNGKPLLTINGNKSFDKLMGKHHLAINGKTASEELM